MITALPLSRSEIWWVRALDFPRLQIAVMALLLLLVEIMVLDHSSVGTWLLYAILGICLAWQLWWIVPFTPLASVEVKDASDPDDANNAFESSPPMCSGPIVTRTSYWISFERTHPIFW